MMRAIEGGSVFARRFVQATSMGVGVVALLVLAGWHWHNTFLCQLHPTLAPMQYNTALGFLLLGGGLMALAQRRRGLSALLGAAVLLLAAATLAQYVLRVDFGIDQLLMRSDIMVRVSHPGRMAPTTAVCFIFCGLLLILETLRQRPWMHLLQALLGAGTFALALSALLGYLSGIDAGLLVDHFTSMAVHTVALFLAIGASLLVWSWGQNRRGLAVAYVAIAGTLLSFQTFLVFRHAEYRGIYADFTLQADDYLNTVQRDVMRDLEAVESVARLYAASQAIDRDEFRAFVEPLVARLPWIQAIQWLPRIAADERARYEAEYGPVQEFGGEGALRPAAPREHYHPITYMEPIEGLEAYLGVDLGADPMRHATIEAAETTGQMQVTGWLPRLRPGPTQLNFFVVAPVRNYRQQSEGLVVGVFRAHRAFYAAGTGNHGVAMEIYVADETTPLAPLLFHLEPKGMITALPAEELMRLQAAFYRDQLLSLPGRRWRVLCVPAPHWVESQRTWHPWLAGGFGLLLTLVFCLYLGALSQRARAIERQVAERTEEITAANALLRRQQATLRESEERFRMLTVHAPVGIYLTDAQGQWRFVNDAWLQLSGQTAEESHGSGWVQAIHPEDRGRVAAEWQGAHAQGATFHSEYRCRRPDGTVSWVESLGVPLRDAQGQLMGYVGTVTDMTARIGVEQQRREQQGVLARVTDAVPGVVYQYQLTKDGNQRFLFASRGTMPIFGLPPERVLEDFSQIWSLIVPEDVPGVVASIQQSAATLKPWVHEFRVQTGEGELKWIRGHSIPEPPGADGSLLWNGILLDVTEERRTQRWLQQLSSVVEQTADIVVITDRHGIIEYVNPSFERQTGYTRAEVVGQTPRILKSGKHPTAFYETLWRTILAGRVFRAEMINRRKNGELYHDEQTITPIRDAQGEVAHFVSTARDVTARREADTALQQKLGELERFRLATIDREHRMIELKQQINQLCQELGRPAPQDLSFLPKNGGPS